MGMVLPAFRAYLATAGTSASTTSVHMSSRAAEERPSRSR